MKFCQLRKFQFIAFLSTLINCSNQERLIPEDFLNDGGEIKNCGQIEEIVGDSRTIVPWSANIFIKKKIGANQPTMKWVPFNNGVVIADQAILTVFGGAYGQINTSGYYQIHSIKKFLIGLGIKSTKIEDYDQYSQFYKVKYIEPFKNHTSGNTEYHMFIFHLENKIKFDTPYVRSICMLDKNAARAFQGFYDEELYSVDLSVFSDIITDVYFIGGYTNRMSPSMTSQLQVHTVDPGNKEYCDRAFHHFYKKKPGGHNYENLCGRLKFRGETFDDGICLKYGSSVFMLSKGQRFMTGMTILTPNINRKLCNKNSLYFVASIWHYIDWIYRSLECSPNHSCLDGTCIGLDRVCNGVKDCPGLDDSDEDEIFCKATNYCQNNFIPCHYNGKCTHISDKNRVLCS